ncbi:hypothetical protein O7621_13465 [Solwaraspora sp. WMMD937]|uniref:hypothetical protein n=1 Tax=Solwaraspora sp. WMMD937 TaxID=3016090 RepID=UPI00249C6D8F|nr:hypothetical protein [Solwaraspora sp. WMMD937]WFE24177.1 hypothetical protein O7621_13465 [Solwaraspora sp. WMMD937]
MGFHRELSPTSTRERTARTPSTPQLLGLLAAAAMFVGAVTATAAGPQAQAGSVPAEATSDPRDMHW